jgi:hypothetical protein
VGYYALYANTTGATNTAIGSLSLQLNTTGGSNVGIGYAALYSNTTGGNNTAIGQALFSNTVGGNNSSYGQVSLYSNISGNGNTALGYAALYASVGNNNIGVGNSAGYNLIGGSGNLIIGGVTLPAATSLTDTIVIGTGSGIERIRITATGEMGINTTAPDASAALDVVSTTKGILFPRMTTVQKNAIASPVAGLVVYDTTLNKLCVRTAAAWETITSV